MHQTIWKRKSWSCHGQEKGGTDAERLRVFDWFAERVLPRHREVGIGHAQLLRLLTTDARRTLKNLKTPVTKSPSVYVVTESANG